MACRFTLTQRVLPQGVKFPYRTTLGTPPFPCCVLLEGSQLSRRIRFCIGLFGCPLALSPSGQWEGSPAEAMDRLHCSEEHWRAPVLLSAGQPGAPVCSKACFHGSWICFAFSGLPADPLFFFLWYGRWRSKTRSLHEKKRVKNPHGHDWSHAVWQIKMNRNTKDTTKTQRHANPPARFAFRHSENSKANSKRGKSPTKTPTQEDLPQDTVVHTTVSIKTCIKTN